MNINELFKKCAQVGVVRITFGLDDKAHPVALGEQYITDPDGFQTHTQHQSGAATHEAAALKLLHRATVEANILKPVQIVEPDQN